MLANRVVQRHLTLFHELRDGDGREHFIHGTEIEFRFRAIGLVPSPTRKSARLGEYDFVAMSNQYSARKSVGRAESLHAVLCPGRDLRVIEGTFRNGRQRNLRRRVRAPEAQTSDLVRL